MKKIDHHSRTPKYLQLKEIILNQIRRNKLHIGDKVPSRAQLMDKYQISDNTCKKALLSLIQDNVLEGHQGKGIYVRNIYAPQDIKKIAFLVWKGKEILNHPASSQTVNGLMNAIADTDHQLFFSFLDPLEESEEEIEAKLRNLNADAVIIGFIPRFTCEVMEIFTKDNIPVVTLGWKPTKINSFSIVDNLSESLIDVCLHLLNHGIKRVGYIGSPVNGLREKRFDAFKSAFKQKDLTFNLKYAKTGNAISSQCGATLCRELLKENPLPEAVFVDDDNVCLGVLEVLREKQISVPNQIKIIRIGGWLDFLSVSTIKIPFFNLAKEAAQTVDNILNNKTTVITNLVIPCEIKFEKGLVNEIK